MNYYQAHSTAFLNHSVPTQPPKDVWSWRLPTVFYIWKLLPGSNGIWIYYLFILLSCITLFVSSKLLGKSGSLPYVSLIPTYYLYSYLHLPAYDWTILQVEWWAILFALIGFYAHKHGRVVLMSLCFTLALLSRELLLIPFGIIAFLAIVKKKKDWVWYMLPVIIFAIFIVFHALNIRAITHLTSSDTPFKLRLHGGIALFNNTFAFGSWEYALFTLRPLLLIYFFNSLILIVKRSWEAMLYLSFFTLPLSYLVIGTSTYNQAWGVLFVPVILISLGLSINTICTKFAQAK